MQAGRRRKRAHWLRRFGVSETGATAIEYALIAALIAIVIITALRTVGTSLQRVFNNVSSTLSRSVTN